MGSPVRICRAVAALVALASLAVAARARADDRKVLVWKHGVNATPGNDQIARELAYGAWDDQYASGLEKGALCYAVDRYGDIRDILSIEQERQLLGNDSLTDATLGAVRGIVSDPYLATLVINRINDSYSVVGTVLDVTSSRALARGERSASSETALLEALPALGEELGRKLPCFVQVTGKRQIDLSKVTQATTGRLGLNMELFRAMAPLALGDEPTFTGQVTETDTITFAPQISGDQTLMTGHASWQAVIEAPVVGMTSREVDAVVKRAPYTLSFTEDLSASYDDAAHAAHLDVELTDQTPQTDGPGSADVTLKDQLAGFGDIANAIGALAQQLTGQDVKAFARQQAQADDPNVKMSDDLHHGVVTLPDPRNHDSAYFKLAFDVALKKPDDTAVKGSDEVGTFDYVVHITTKPPQ